jgi:hypothetical protein
MAGIVTPLIPNQYFFSPQRYDAAGDLLSNFWVEQVGNVSPNQDAFGSKYAYASLYAWVDDENTYDFINSVLGYTVVNNVATETATLSRTLPMQHPKYQNLWASKINSLQGISYTQKENAVITGSLEYFAQYKYCNVQVEFAPLRYSVMTDDQISGESEAYRYVQWDATPKTYVATLQLGQFQFADGTTGSPKGVAFPGEVNFFEVKTTLNWKWHLVPEAFVFDLVTYSPFGLPTKISANNGTAGCAGTVNAYDVWGFPQGTLLLLDPIIDRYVSGTLASVDGQDPVYMCDVTYPIIHFDPIYYNINYRGHLTKPWFVPGTPVQYYWVTADGTAGGGTIYRDYDFSTLFDPYSAP